MSINVTCQCGANLRANDDLAGVQVRCPRCKQPLTLPAASGTPAPSASAPVPAVGHRQRMYAFERAYVAFALRAKRYYLRVTGSCREVWKWFWNGKGCEIIEILLRIAVVVSGIVAGVLYMRYENAHGRSFGVAMLFTFLLIAVYVSVVVWGYKALVHWLARVVSGASAAGIVLVLSLLAVVAASVVFSAYLLGLFGLTALSFIVFLPLRAAQEIALLYRRIAYECPHDDCPDKGKRLPIHVCSCGAEYPDLKPSFYGIFHHKCWHSDGTSSKVPTMDWLGRYKLDRRCSGCHRPLVNSPFGPSRPFPVLVVGATNAGKTVLVLQAVQELKRHFESRPGCKATIASNEPEFKKGIVGLGLGRLPGKTVGGAMKATSLALRMPARRSQKVLLQLYDSPGEHFETIEDFGRKQVLQRVEGIVLLVDLFSLSKLAGSTPAAPGNPARASATTTMGNLVEMMNLMRKASRGGTFDVPVAVVLGKADALPADQFPALKDLYRTNGQAIDQTELNHRCREAIIALGGKVTLRTLQQSFSNVRFFACTALGREPQGGDASPFKPTGVTEPFLWLMGDGQPP